MDETPKNILIFGSTGMLGVELCLEAKSRGLHVIGASKNSSDFKVDLAKENEITESILELKPQIIINSAAIVSYSQCENNYKLANLINSLAVGVMATAANKINANLVQISTDSYYSGDGAKAHTEIDPVTPTSQYAKTKYAGERHALKARNGLVIRTNITGFRLNRELPSFIEWAIQSLQSGNEFKLFKDYYASTITTRQASSIIFDLLFCGATGCLNVACREVISKKKFVMAFAKKTGLRLDNMNTASVHEHQSGRAESIGLDVTRTERILGYKLPNLNKVINQLASEYFELKKSGKLQ